MISLNQNALAEIDAQGVSVRLTRNGKASGSAKAIIESSRLGYFAALPASALVKSGDVLATTEKHICAVRRVASNPDVVIWLCQSAPKQKPLTGGK